MELREYLFRKRMKISEFSKQINYGRGYINEIINGTKKPGKKIAEAIEKATNGEVTAQEVLKDKE